MRIVLLVTLLLGSAGMLCAQDGEVELGWKPGTERVARYYSEGAAGFTVVVPDDEWKVDQWTGRPMGYQFAYHPVVLHVPKRKAKVGDTWNARFTVTPFACKRLTIAGKVTLDSVVDDPKHGRVAVIKGTFALRGQSAPPRDPRMPVVYSLSKVDLTYTARIGLREGAVLQADFKVVVAGHQLMGKRKQPLPSFPRAASIVLQSAAERLAALRAQVKTILPHRKFAPCPQVDIDKAIEGGVKYLLKQQRLSGGWRGDHAVGQPSGESALALLALLKCDVSPKGRPVRRAVGFLAKQNPTRTYELGLVCMAMHAYAEAQAEPAAVGPPKKHRLTGPAKALLHRAVKRLVADMRSGAWHYGGPSVPGSFDNSNTQYAVLGLRAAELAGVTIPAKVWVAVLKHQLAEQGRDYRKPGAATTGDDAPVEPRGWGYAPRTNSGLEMTSMTMTCAGVACLLIARERLQAAGKLPKALIEPTARALADARGWLDINYPSTVGPALLAVMPGSGSKRPMAPGYMLYGIERVGVLAKIKHFEGGLDWYQEGARVLLEAQDKRKGGFNDLYKPLVGTAFALLFLKRATTPLVVLTEK